MARQFTAVKAERKKVRLKIGMSGPAGAGKTLSSLRMAFGIVGDWSKIAVLDTENNSALYYVNATVEGSHIGEFLHIPFEPPYSPNDYIEAIKYAQSIGIECLIIDSATHEWSGKGGCLDIQQKLGGRFQDWAKVTPMHDAFVDQLRNCDMHIIATIRSKTDYAVSNENGKNKVEKLGTKSEQRDGLEYEFGLVFDCDMQHNAKSTKDRTQMFSDGVPLRITEETGKKLIQWANSGAEVTRPQLHAVPEKWDGSNPAHRKLVGQAAKQLGISDLSSIKDRLEEELTCNAMATLDSVTETLKAFKQE